MPEKKIDINLPVAYGLNKDGHPSELNPYEYIFALNAVTESFNGDLNKLANEPSNLLCSKFKEGYKVVGFKRDYNSNNTYFFLTNPVTKVSEIGYVKTPTEIEEDRDVDLYCGCDIKKVLAEPLELQELKETCIYETIISDECNKCLNFSVNHPILSIELKVEKAETKLFFTDDYNPPRYLNLSKLENYYFHSQQDCENDAEIDCSEQCPECEDCTKCLDCEKLKIFVDYNKPCSSSVQVATYGNLSMGKYELFMVYCDEIGREVSQFYRLTNPISIFDERYKVSEQSLLDAKTNKSIVVTLEGLNTTFKHYKVVSYEISKIAGEPEVRDVGIFSTDNNEVVYSDNGKISENVTLRTILKVNPRWTKSRGMTVNDGQLYQFGLESKKYYNLQKVVNLMSPFLRWQTNVAKENLYSFNDQDSLYSQYMRNENYGFSIKFFGDDGTESFLFPFTFRPPTSQEEAIIPETNKDLKSILDANKDCFNDRTRFWQIYNSAQAIEGSSCENDFSEEGYSEITVNKTVSCNTDFIKEFIPWHGGESDIILNIWNPEEDIFDLSLSDLMSSNILDFLPAQITVGGITYIFNENGVDGKYYSGGGDFHNVLVEFLEQEACSIDSDDICQVSSEPNGQPNIVFLSLTQNSKFFIPKTSILGETPSLYNPTPPIEYCDLYEYDNNNEKYLEDWAKQTGYETYTNAYKRKSSLNIDCNSVIDLQEDFLDTYIHPQITPEPVLADIYHQNVTIPCNTSIVGGFEDKLSKSALYFKGDFKGEDTYLIELGKLHCEDDLYDANWVRVSTYDTCPDGSTAVTSIYCETLVLDENRLVVLNRADYASDEFYIAIDLGVFAITSTTEPTLYSPAYLCGCLNVRHRPLEFSAIQYHFRDLSLRKIYQYNAECTYRVPKVSDCEIKPFIEGEFGYYESTKRYPNNRQLYDSKDVVIKESEIPSKIKDRFEEIFVDSINADGEYVLNDDACLMDKPIRFYKFPDNSVAPFMYTEELSDFSDSIIFPIGVKIDNEIIRFFLDVAVQNGIIDQETRDSITKYEIYRTDRTLHKSIIAKGLLFDTYKYENLENREVLYANYPYNSLGSDRLNFQSTTIQDSIKHPYNSERNNIFTFHSPDTHFRRPSETSFNEIYIEGYQYGKSDGDFKKVLEHSKQTILGSKSTRLANILAGSEALLELVLEVGNMSTGHPLTSVVGITAGLFAVTQSAFKAGQYRYQWLETFYNLKPPENYAYKYASFGKYNFLKDFHDQEQLVRGISVAKYLKGSNYYITELQENSSFLVNNTDRESTLLLSLGKHHLEYNSNYRTYDNASLNNGEASRRTASEADVCNDDKGFVSNIASPYVTIRNFLPAQYGDIDNIVWLNTGYCGVLSEDNECDTIFGGDTRISRMSLKRKMPLFLNHMVGLADKTPFTYTLYGNVGSPRFFANFRTEDSELAPPGIGFTVLGQNFGATIGDLVFPRIRDQYRLDCYDKNNTKEAFEIRGRGSSENNFYYAPKNLKFYLQYYGVPYFLVESEINLNYRYGRKEPWEWYYPDGGATDLDFWTQEYRVPIRYDNEYNYNELYSRVVTRENRKTLPRNYDKKDFDKFQDFRNGVISSEIDRTESSTSEPWLIYKPFNIYEFDSSLGKLVDLKGIESFKMLARFENQYMIINPLDTLRERIDGYNREVGVGIFQQRPIETTKSEIGYAGTQHREMVSCEFGRFFVDAVRGQVLMMPTGSNSVIDIASYKRDMKPSGMRRWFKEQLPFKILQGGIEGLTSTDVDNSYNFAGITMVWDNLLSRLLITKKDYIVKDQHKGTLKFEDNKILLKENNQEVTVENTDIFEEASFTISYYPAKDFWVGFHSYRPNYYVGHNNFFQSGINSNNSDNGLWSHLLTNKSYQVFYGKKEPFIIETVRKTEIYNKVFHSFDYHLDVRRYHNKYDYAENTSLNFNKGYVYNKDNNSGLLKFVNAEPNNYFQQARYPKTNSDSTEILVGYSYGKWSFNTVFNKVRNPLNNVPIWNNDNVWVNKSLNDIAINYLNNWNERLRGNYYIIRMEQDEDTRHNFIYRWGISKDMPNI